MVERPGEDTGDVASDDDGDGASARLFGRSRVELVAAFADDDVAETAGTAVALCVDVEATVARDAAVSGITGNPRRIRGASGRELSLSASVATLVAAAESQGCERLRVDLSEGELRTGDASLDDDGDGSSTAIIGDCCRTAGVTSCSSIVASSSGNVASSSATVSSATSSTGFDAPFCAATGGVDGTARRFGVCDVSIDDKSSLLSSRELNERRAGDGDLRRFLAPFDNFLSFSLLFLCSPLLIAKQKCA